MEQLRVGLIGAGKVGVVLAAALLGQGHDVVAVSRGSGTSQTRSESMLGAVPLLMNDEVADGADVVLVCVPDDRLARVLEETRWRAGQIVVHVSGRHGLNIGSGLAQRGVTLIAAHPAMTFTGYSVDLGRLPGCCFAVTASAVAMPFAQHLVEYGFGGKVIVLQENQRTLYHAALCHATNYLVTLLGQSCDMLETAGVGVPEQLLRPLVEAALHNVLGDGAEDRGMGEAALTGPIARGDAGTVADHLREITAVASEDVADTYRALGEATATRAVRDGRLRPDQATDVRTALANPSH